MIVAFIQVYLLFLTPVTPAKVLQCRTASPHTIKAIVCTDTVGSNTAGSTHAPTTATPAKRNEVEEPVNATE